MIFTPAGLKIPDIVREKRWFDHPVQLRCLCGISLRARTYQNEGAFVTRMECGEPKCGKLLFFIDILVDNHPTTNAILTLAGVPADWTALSTK